MRIRGALIFGGGALAFAMLWLHRDCGPILTALPWLVGCTP